jgi:hypothetical protein
MNYKLFYENAYCFRIGVLDGVIIDSQFNTIKKERLTGLAMSRVGTAF